MTSRIDSDGEEVEVIYNEIDVEPGEIFGESASPEKIINESLAIKRKIEEYDLDRDDDEQCTVLLKKIQKKHKDFYTSFPVVVRWMVQVGEYRESIFRTYLDRYSKKIGPTGMWKTRSDFLENQAEYLRMLLEDKNRKAGRANARGGKDARGKESRGKDARSISGNTRKLTKKQIYEYKANILAQLEREDREFKSASDEAKKKVEKINKSAAERRRRNILALHARMVENSDGRTAEIAATPSGEVSPQ